MFIYASPKTMKVTINQSKCMHSSETKGLNLIKLSSEMLQNSNIIFFPFSSQDNGMDTPSLLCFSRLFHQA